MHVGHANATIVLCDDVNKCVARVYLYIARRRMSSENGLSQNDDDDNDDNEADDDDGWWLRLR